MPELKITIGGRSFDVACQQGEEHFLRTAAGLLDAEASVLVGQIGKMPEARMLLMAGLLVADKAAGTGDKIAALEARLAEAEAELARLQMAAEAEPPDRPVAAPVEIPVIPQDLEAQLALLAAQAEALADHIEAVG